MNLVNTAPHIELFKREKTENQFWYLQNIDSRKIIYKGRFPAI